MYLKKLYTTSKGWFIVITLFVIVQVATDIRQDISLSPVFHYGMYSEVIKPQNTYVVTEIWVNGRRLQTKDFSPCGWDKVKQPVMLYKNQQSWNDAMWNADIKRLLHVSDSTKYINAITDSAFNKWYLNYLQTFIQEKIDSVRITTTNYNFTGKQLVKNDN